MSTLARIATTPRGEIEYAETGDPAAPAVLALHGAMGGFDQGLILARSAGLAAGFRAIAPSRPGYLGTPLASGRTPEEQADLFAALLDAAGVRAATVVAVSGGGPSALHFALRHAERCRALVLVSAASGRIEARLPFAWHVLKLAARWPALLRAMQRRAARDPERAMSRSIPDPAQRARLLRDPEAWGLMQELQRSTGERMARRLAGTENDIATTRGKLELPLEQLAVPVLVVHGTADRHAPFAHAEAVARRAPGAELLAIEGGEHACLFTHLAEIRGRIASFLAVHPEAPAPIETARAASVAR